MRNDEMKKILLNLFAGSYYLELVIDLFLLARNRFAHELSMNIDVPPRNLAKNVCELFIEWFLSQFDQQFSNREELGKIYEFVQEDNVALQTNKKVIDTILKARVDITKESPFTTNRANEKL